MCWITYFTKHGTPIKAENDVKVFKVCTIDRDGYAIPYYMHFNSRLKYEKGVTYHLPIKLEIFKNSTELLSLGGFHADYGFHAYSSQHCQYGKSGEYILTSDIEVLTVSDVDDKHRCDCYRPQYYGNAILECSIPEGTIYYENENGEIVTEVLRVDNIKTK